MNNYIFCPKDEMKVPLERCNKCDKHYGNCKSRLKKMVDLGIFEGENLWHEIKQRAVRL